MLARLLDRRPLAAEGTPCYLATTHRIPRDDELQIANLHAEAHAFGLGVGYFVREASPEARGCAQGGLKRRHVQILPWTFAGLQPRGTRADPLCMERRTEHEATNVGSRPPALRAFISMDGCPGASGGFIRRSTRRAAGSPRQ